MYHLKLIACFAFVVAFAKGCEFNDVQMEKYSMECVAAHSDPAFMMEVATHMDNPNSIATPEFICKYQSDLVNIVECMKDKIQGCIPEMYKPLMELFPSKERLTDGVKFMCDNKEVLQNKCMQDHVMDVYTCYMGKIGQLQSRATTTSDMKGLFCSVIRSEEQCFRDHKGTCSSEYIEVIVQLIEKIFPTSSCGNSAVASSNSLANTVLGSLLIHGQPQGDLRFKPNSVYRPYNVVKN